MIDFLKTEYVTMDYEGSQETRVVAKLPLVASVTMSKASELYVANRVEFRSKMAKMVRQALWAGAYHDLIGPVKELQAKALYLAKEEPDLHAVREIIGRIDKLLTCP